MILSGLFDRYPRLKIAVAHMGGGLLSRHGRLDFGWRLGCDGMPARAIIAASAVRATISTRLRRHDGRAGMPSQPSRQPKSSRPMTGSSPPTHMGDRDLQARIAVE